MRDLCAAGFARASFCTIWGRSYAFVRAEKRSEPNGIDTYPGIGENPSAVGLPDPNDVAAYDELEQRLIGGPMPLTGPIELHEYDPRWPEQYAEQAARLGARSANAR